MAEKSQSRRSMTNWMAAAWLLATLSVTATAQDSDASKSAAPAGSTSTSATASSEPAEAGPTAESVLDRYIEVTGGKEAYARIVNRVVKLRQRLAAGMNVSTTRYAAAPDKLLIKMELTSAPTMTRGHLAGLAWLQDAEGRSAVLKGRDRDAVLASSLFNATLRWREQYPEVALVGVERVGQETVDVVELTDTRGRKVRQMYGRESGLLLKQVTADVSLSAETTYSDYREVDGIRYPFRYETNQAGRRVRSLVDSVAHNVAMQPGFFAVPDEVLSLLNDRGPEGQLKQRVMTANAAERAAPQPAGARPAGSNTASPSAGEKLTPPAPAGSP